MLVSDMLEGEQCRVVLWEDFILAMYVYIFQWNDF